MATKPSAAVDLEKKGMSDEKIETHECAYMSSEVNKEVNVAVIGGAPELWVT